MSCENRFNFDGIKYNFILVTIRHGLRSEGDVVVQVLSHEGEHEGGLPVHFVVRLVKGFPDEPGVGQEGGPGRETGAVTLVLITLPVFLSGAAVGSRKRMPFFYKIKLLSL